MKWIVLITTLLVSLAVKANEDSFVCHQYGFTQDPERFHSLSMSPQVHTFDITADRVIYQGRLFIGVEPRDYDFDDTVVTYLNAERNEILYFYLVDEQPEIGISRLVEDSDTFFSDKALFTHCSFIPKGGSDVDDASQHSSRVKTGGISGLIPVRHF